MAQSLKDALDMIDVCFAAYQNTQQCITNFNNQ
nr:MAG TPA: hypothetical protein [Caudoviricetes sp.]